jgi:hypothetical protein
MRFWLTVATTTALLMVAAPSAGAQTARLPVGEANGVRIVRPHDAIVVVFGPTADRLWRRVAGKRVSVMCTRGPFPAKDGFFITEEGGTSFRAPRRGRRLRTGDLTRGMDFCEVWLDARTVRRNGARRRFGRELIVAIPLTQRGAVRLDERTRAFALWALLNIAIVSQESDTYRFAAPADFTARVPSLRRPLELPVVALSTPSDTPSAGSIGYYSDGAQHAAAVLLSASGRRLFLELDADEVIRTNVGKYVYGDE